jgi:acetate kinase
LVFNAGSSSLKFELFVRDREWRSRLRGAVRDIGGVRPVLEVEGQGSEDAAAVSEHREAAERILDRLMDAGQPEPLSVQDLVATGHRVVHGGERFSAPTTVTAALMTHLEAIGHLAPLHNPAALSVMRLVLSRLPDVPAVAVFDTAFFRELPEHVQTYAVPRAWSSRYGIRRYGFHGIAHEDLYRRLSASRHDDRPPRRVLSLHLGQGCSIAALRDGRPVETSMGFTPLEGLIMGTRPGDLDVGAVLHMARQGRSWSELERTLNHEAGLLGISGVSGDVRELLGLEDQGDSGARAALAAFCHRLHKYLGAYAAVLGGVDSVVFGGGIGENSPRLRARVCSGLAWLGLQIDESANARCVGSDGRISSDSSAIAVHVIRVREEQAIARAALASIGASEGNAAAAAPFE